MATLSPKLTATPTVPPTYNVGMAETFSWVPIEGAGRPLFARAGDITKNSHVAEELNVASLCVNKTPLNATQWYVNEVR